ncbi:hypothetical protein PACTADRAFT_50566 [Pachysolen tannophilus NRRL Y-2460]|uniref:tRNA N(3)-methylcytidine methyltransferase n=1 Tax=Pachysolen tannophilus NRRL Y-2460 TaxID=669874 RepID=A0A1E4TSI8_PACTA|nr:hypothetical protein PACTADRAFT_50566 [Pachysolen tannophilus NRRL Y-2460]
MKEEDIVAEKISSLGLQDVETLDVKPSLDTRIGKDDPFVFGQRFLENEDDVFSHNAWDHAEWGEEQRQEAEAKIAKQYDAPVDEFDKNLYNSNPARYWDIFYKNTKGNFFKDRKWLQIEFPILYDATKENSSPVTILEVGCGNGSTLFPVLRENKNENLKIVAVDYSKNAINIVKSSQDFNPKYAHACVWDLGNEAGESPETIEPHSVDIVTLVFVLSALHPNQWETAVKNLAKILKPGGQILFRDYGRYDMAQVRFKKKRLLEDNFYIRGDGTRVYFFTEEELKMIFGTYFKERKIATDRRLLVNRKKQLKMYRIWLQAVFDVPL